MDWKVTGRKYSLILSFGLTALCLIVTIIFADNEKVFIYSTSVGKFWISMAFTIVIQYTLEVYNTDIRVYAYGIFSIVARIGGIMTPIAGFGL